MDRPLNVVLIGDVCIDHNIHPHGEYFSWGSPALFTAQYLTRSELATPTVISERGPDFAAYANGFSFYPAAARLKETVVFVNDTRGDVRIQKCHNMSASHHVPLDGTYKSLLSDADVVIVCTFLPSFTADYLRTILRETSKNALKVLIPQGFLRQIGPSNQIIPQESEQLRKVIDGFDLMILSDEDYPDATAWAHKWLDINNRIKIVVTEAESGATVIAKNQTEHIPTQPIPDDEYIDSVGAGDVFTAATALSYAANRDIVNAVKAGHAAAAEHLRSRAVGVVEPDLDAV
ncbi:MAG: hypothetical protein JWL85_843 [Candidatus Saccharibacteria bacterium]|nr:hypothetical protein [Candidatus Saccharibacteria bacterium]